MWKISWRCLLFRVKYCKIVIITNKVFLNWIELFRVKKKKKKILKFLDIWRHSTFKTYWNFIYNHTNGLEKKNILCLVFMLQKKLLYEAVFSLKLVRHPVPLRWHYYLYYYRRQAEREGIEEHKHKKRRKEKESLGMNG